MVRNSTERLGGDYDLEPRGSAVSCTLLTRSQPAFYHLQVWYHADFKGMVFLVCFSCYLTVSFLADCASVHSDSKKLRLLTRA